MKKNVILVPTDFTKVADCAIMHAVKIANIIDGEVILLHVVGKQEEVDEAKVKVDQLAQKTQDWHNINTRGAIRIGNIFDDIGDAASELNARLIIMGTHGVKGIQHLTGSYALRVITHSIVPFIVVQEEEPKNDYKNIVLPLDLSKETKQKLKHAVEIAEYFKSKIHLITPKETDEYLRNQLHRNIAFSKKYLTEHGISFTTNTADKGSFAKEVIKFAVGVDADLISIMNLRENSLMGMLGSSYEQQMITNEAQIPVMCVNPKDITAKGGIFS